MSNRTIGLIVALFIVTAALIYIAVGQKNPPGSTSTSVTRNAPKPTPYQQSNLFFSPNSLTVSSSSGSIDVNIETGGNSVTAVQLEMTYDPKSLSKVDISSGTFFPDPAVLLKKIDPVAGRITYALGIQINAKGQKGGGTVAKITFTQTPSATQTALTFLPKTLVTAEGVRSSVLKSTENATITFTAAQTKPPAQQSNPTEQPPTQ